VLANALTIVAAGLVAIKPFFGPRVETPKRAREAPLSMWLGPVTLAALGLLLGLSSATLVKRLLPITFDQAIVSPAVCGILGKEIHVHLHLFPASFTTMLMLSIITIALGVAGYFLWDPLYRALRPANIITRWGPEQWYRRSLAGMMSVARLQTNILQNGYLRYYLLTILGTTVILTGYTLFTQGGAALETMWRRPNSTIYEILIYATILAAAIMVILTRSRLAAVAALGVVGYGISLIFVLFGAPDLAMTQFNIETLSVILLVLVLYRLPRFTLFSTNRQRWQDATVALLSGGLMTLLVLVVTSLPARSRLTPYFAENSLRLAHGHNVVNVILVDFRGFDTMGEITVLSIAAIGVFALLKLRLDKDNEAGPQPVKSERYEIIGVPPAKEQS